MILVFQGKTFWEFHFLPESSMRELIARPFLRTKIESYGKGQKTPQIILLILVRLALTKDHLCRAFVPKLTILTNELRAASY